MLTDIPSLAGQPRVFLENQLVVIREGLRDIPAMKGLLDGVSDADLAAMASHPASAAPDEERPALRRPGRGGGGTPTPIPVAWACATPGTWGWSP